MFVTPGYAQETAPAEGERAWRGAMPATRERPRRRHEAGAFPPFDARPFPSQLLWLAITFGLFYLFLKKVVLPRIGGILEDRRDRIAQDLDQAARMKGEADAAVAAYEQELAEAKAKANAIGQQARDARQGRRRGRAQEDRGRARREARRGRGAHRRRSSRRPCAKSARSPRIPPPPSSQQLIGGKVDKAAVAAAVKSAAGRRRVMDATFWATVALVIFLGVVVYFKVPGDDRPSRSTSAPTRSATSSTRPGACARRPSSCSPSTSASARKPRRRPPTSSPRPSARPTCSSTEAQAEDRGICRRAAPRWPSRRSRQAEREAVNEVRASAVDIAVEAARTLLADQGRRRDRRRPVQVLARGRQGQAELSVRSRIVRQQRSRAAGQSGGLFRVVPVHGRSGRRRAACSLADCGKPERREADSRCRRGSRRRGVSIAARWRAVA